MANVLRSLSFRSVDVDPAPPARRDVVLAVALALVAVADIPEGVATWEPATSLVGITTALVVIWRRSRPLAVVVVVFGAQFLIDLGSGLADARAELPFGQLVTMAVVAYALARWAIWRDVILGLALITVLEVAGEPLATITDWGELWGQVLTWGLAAAIGVAVRYRAASIRFRADQVRYQERERIARELHDVIAHHVSAIAIQAEGARAVAQSNPSAATEALARIHSTASRVLLDMRQIVGILRDPEDRGHLLPQAGLKQLAALATSGTEAPMIEVSIEGEVHALPTGVGAALFRIAQEAVTNARRHAVGAKKVSIVVARHPDAVSLLVADDGRPVSGQAGPGYGLVGMNERATMLGGTFEAGPRSGGAGWRVQATIPLDGAMP